MLLQLLALLSALWWIDAPGGFLPTPEDVGSVPLGISAIPPGGVTREPPGREAAAGEAALLLRRMAGPVSQLGYVRLALSMTLGQLATWRELRSAAPIPLTPAGRGFERSSP